MDLGYFSCVETVESLIEPYTKGLWTKVVFHWDNAIPSRAEPFAQSNLHSDD